MIFMVMLQVEKGAPVISTAGPDGSPPGLQPTGLARGDASARLLPIYGINLVGLCAALRYFVSLSSLQNVSWPNLSLVWLGLLSSVISLLDEQCSCC